jgi:hypothetical protein
MLPPSSFYDVLHENDDPATHSGDLQQLRVHHVRVSGWPVPSFDFASYSLAVEQSAPARDVEADKASARGTGGGRTKVWRTIPEPFVPNGLGPMLVGASVGYTTFNVLKLHIYQTNNKQRSNKNK